MRSLRHLMRLSAAMACLAGCASEPGGAPEEVEASAPVLGQEVGLVSEPVVAVRVRVDPVNVAHVAVLTEKGRLLHLAVRSDGSVVATDLGEVDPRDAFDIAVSPNGVIHVLLAEVYLRVSAMGRTVGPAGRCERLALAGVQALCLGTFDPAFPESSERGPWEPVGVVGPLQGRKLVLYSFEGDRWRVRTVLERDSAWNVGRAEIVADRGQVAHVWYEADGPLDASIQRRLVRATSFRLPEGIGEAEPVRAVDLWELGEGSDLPVPAEVDTVSGRPLSLLNRRRYGFTEGAASEPLFALGWPAGVRRTMLGSEQRTVQVGTDPPQVLVLKDGRLLHKIPLQPGGGGWTTFVLAVLLAPAGEDRIHAVTVAKGDLLGFANRVRYQETTGGRWSRGLELGLAGDRSDLVRLGAGEQRDAFVVMPGPTGGLIGRWITRDRQAQQRRE